MCMAGFVDKQLHGKETGIFSLDTHIQLLVCEGINLLGCSASPEENSNILLGYVSMAASTLNRAGEGSSVSHSPACSLQA